MPNLMYYGFDIEESMVRSASQLLKPFLNKKAFVKKGSLLDKLYTEGYFDIVVSNLVIHNVPYEKKEEAVGKIASYLRKEGIFIWGDIILLDDEEKQRAAHKNRIKHAISKNALDNPLFFVYNFYKEFFKDYCLTTDEMIMLAHAFSLEPYKLELDENHALARIYFRKIR